MGSKVWVAFLLLALAMVAESTYTLHEASRGLARFGNDDVEDLTEPLMDSEMNRRQLDQKKYISYGVLKQDRVPCDRRGRSYYNCQSPGKANPYTRGCSVITHCHRFTD